MLKNAFLKKERLFLSKIKICSNIFFLERGLSRCFYQNNEKEVTSWFMKEGDVIISVESFFKQQKSKENIQALEDCNAFAIDFTVLQFAYKNFPEFNYIGRKLTEKYYIQCEQRLYALKIQNAFERYTNLIENSPELFQRVSSTYIASYLGMRLETLSRMKGKRA